MRFLITVSFILVCISLSASDSCYYFGKKKACLSKKMELTGEMGIRFNDGTAIKARDNMLKKYDLEVLTSYANWPEYILAKIPAGVDAFALSRLLVETGSVKWAQPDWITDGGLLSTTPNDTYYGDMWHHTMIHSPEAWDITTGDPRSIVAIVDCGVETQHPDLVKHMLIGKSFVPSEPAVDPNMNPYIGDTTAYEFAHGTAVSGVAAATGNNGIGTAGVCWNCSILPVKYTGRDLFPASRKLDALKWAVDNGAWVINNSWAIGQDKGTSGDCITVAYDNYAAEAIDYAKTNGRGGRGTITVWASGNSACNTGANENFKRDDIILVSAIRSTGEITDYSNYGYEIDIAAPSGFDTVDKKGLVTTDVSITGKGYNPHYGGEYADQAYTKHFSGTSGAAPVVTGAVALMLAEAPYLKLDEAIKCVKDSAAATNADCLYGATEECYGAGILDVAKMVQNARDGKCGGTKECTQGGNECTDGKECWKGICADPVATSNDDDIMPDEDSAFSDDQPDTIELPDEDIVSDQSGQPDKADLPDKVVPDTDTAVNIDNGNTADSTPASDEDTANSSSSGCGCVLVGI